jgi:hypothetical protein
LKVDGVYATTGVIGTDQISSCFAAPSKSCPELLPLETGEVITRRLKRDGLRSLDVVRYDLLGRLFDLVELLEILDSRSERYPVA